MLDNRRFFNLTAFGYDLITSQEIWRAQIREMALLVEEPNPNRIIDLGCGPGISSFVLAEVFPNADIVGVDISESMIARAKRHHEQRFPQLENLRFHHADIYDLPFAPHSFDLATGHSFLYLLPHRRDALSAIEKALNKGGQLILLEPNANGSLLTAGRQATYGRLHRAPLQTTRFALSMLLWRLVSKGRGQMSALQLRELLTGGGFENVAVESTLNGLGLHAACTTTQD